MWNLKFAIPHIPLFANKTTSPSSQGNIIKIFAMALRLPLMELACSK